jgi:hypothetical protein
MHFGAEMDSTETSEVEGRGYRPRVYLEIIPADLGWRYQVLVGITEVERGWRPTWKWARTAGRRARRPYIDEG